MFSVFPIQKISSKENSDLGPNFEPCSIHTYKNIRNNNEIMGAGQAHGPMGPWAEPWVKKKIGAALGLGPGPARKLLGNLLGNLLRNLLGNLLEIR